MYDLLRSENRSLLQQNTKTINLQFTTFSESFVKHEKPTTLFLHWQLVSSWTDSCSIVPATTPMWVVTGTTSEEEDTWKETDLQCRNDSYRSASFITVLPLYFWVSASLQQPTSRYVFGNLHGPSKFHLIRHKHLYSCNTKASPIQEREDIKSTRAQAFVSLTTKSIRETCTG